MIVLPPLLMHMLDEDNSVKPKLGRNLAYSFLNSITYTFNDKNATIKDNSICKDHDHEVLKPHLTSTWMPNSVGSMSGKSVVFAESEVSVVWQHAKQPGKGRRDFNFLIYIHNFRRLCKSRCRYLARVSSSHINRRKCRATRASSA
jgi:hypothetical protein